MTTGEAIREAEELLRIWENFIKKYPRAYQSGLVVGYNMIVCRLDNLRQKERAEQDAQNAGPR